MTPTTILWFRRDLRITDHPALIEASAHGRVVPLFVLDPALLGPAGAPRRAFLFQCLRELDKLLGGRLVVRTGDPVAVVPAVAAEVDADRTLVTADFGPYGRRRDTEVARALRSAERRLIGVGSAYAVDPGRVLKQDGTPFRVFTPYFRAWRAHGWPPPAHTPSAVTWADAIGSDGIPADPPVDATLPAAGEHSALARVEAFLAGPVDDYADRRNDPAADATTRLSPYLKYGCVHPTEILARLGPSPSHEKLRSELAWREFYADVLWHIPGSAWESLQPAMAAIEVDSGPMADERFLAWTEGRTGFPFVDAGMRQLLGQGWMHNRVRMVVASFLVKDLHIHWTRGARWFMRQLVDGDLASNSHGWQWVAGTGTDAAPYFRIFNPVTQGKEHDPHGDYVRRWVPELAEVAGVAVHEPWRLSSGLPGGYAERIVDHAAERTRALARYAALKSDSRLADTCQEDP